MDTASSKDTGTASEGTVTSAQFPKLLFVGLAALAACDRSSDGGASAGIGKLATGGVPKGEGKSETAGPPVIAAWAKAGLAVSAMTKDASGAIGNDCLSGTVSGVDVVVCTFASDQAAKAAEGSGLNWVGDASGASIANGSVALAVADRRNADPSGRTMNQIINVFRPATAKR